MSDNVKGARKPKNGAGRGNTAAGKFQMSPELMITSLIAGIYALFLLEAGLEGGLDALLLSVFLLIAFVVYAYLVKAGSLRAPKYLGSLVKVYLGLSVLFAVWEMLLFFKVIDTTRISAAMWPAVVGVANAVVSLMIIAGIIYVEKDSLKKLYIRLGNFKVLAAGIVGFILFILLAVGAAYFIFGGSSFSQDKFIKIIISVLVFAILSGIYEELWFRGLLLSRITRMIGESQGNIYQAVVFGVFEAVMFYAVTLQVSYMPAIFIIGAMLGYYWGRATVKDQSLVTPILLHIGFYVLVMLPIVVGILS